VDLTLTHRFVLGARKPIRSFLRTKKSMLKILGATSQNLVHLDVCTPGFSHMHWHSSVSHAECVFEDEDDDDDDDDDNNNNIARSLIICTPHPKLFG